MDWSSLDLRKAAVLKKEVDVALVALSKVLAANDAVKKDILIMSIQSRIDDLEAFCVAHDADDRIVLFEKQQLRLRKAIQSHQFHQPGSVSTTSHSVALPPSPTRVAPPRNPEGNSPLSLSALDSRPSPARGVVSSSGKPRGLIGATSGASFGSGSNQAASRGSAGSSRPFPQRAPGQTVASVMLPPPPTESIYEWESKGSGDAAPKKRLFLDGSSYCPTTQPGMYVREIRDDSQPANPEDDYNESPPNENPANNHQLGPVVGVVGNEDLRDGYVDFQIVLTAEEMMALISRRRITSRPDIQLAKSQLVSGNVHISTPFVDQSRVMKAHLRPDNPEKWMDKDGIRPNKW